MGCVAPCYSHNLVHISIVKGDKNTTLIFVKNIEKISGNICKKQTKRLHAHKNHGSGSNYRAALVPRRTKTCGPER